MPEMLDWHRADLGEVLNRAVTTFRNGGLVIFPTEAAYTVAASALVPEAVARLQQVGQQLVAVGNAGEALDWAPHLSPVGRRLTKRCWPGPMTLVVQAGAEQGLASRLPQMVQAQVLTADGVTLRCPGHEAIRQVMGLLPAPLLLAEAGNGQPAYTADQAADALADRVDLVIDAGPSRYAMPSTLVKVTGESWTVLREGVFSNAALAGLLPCRIVFVCTGNTCRSPLAEVLCKKLLAARLSCPLEELPQRGFLVHSAGIAAMMGGPAAPEAVDTAREFGADLTGHQTQPITRELLGLADYVIAMTRGHSRALTSAGAVGPAPRLLARDGSDVPDPIGASPEVYRECARQILGHLEALVPELK
jgi:protein-tyrosine phosphatase